MITRNICEDKYEVVKLQFAEGSNWEHCCVLEKKSGIEIFGSWAAKAVCKNLALEAFFDVPEFGITGAFVGFRFKSSACLLSMFERAAQIFTDSKKCSLNAVITEAEKHAGSPLFACIPEYAELGVINYWNSFGSVKLRHISMPECCEEIKTIVGSDPKWQRAPGITAVEFAYTTPIPHWIGCDCTKLANLYNALNDAVPK